MFNAAFTEETNLIDLACLFFECRPEQLKSYLNNNVNRAGKQQMNRFWYPKDLKTFNALLQSNFFFKFKHIY